MPITSGAGVPARRSCSRHVLRPGGSTWEPTGLLAEPQTVVTALAVGPGDQVVVATTAADILRSKDAGRTWQALLQRGRPAASGR